jgi:hypothetical protein
VLWSILWYLWLCEETCDLCEETCDLCELCHVFDVCDDSVISVMILWYPWCICDDYVIYIWLCDIYFVCLDGTTKTNKKMYFCNFTECQGHSTRQRRHTWEPVKLLCRVLWPWHSAKREPLPSTSYYTRQRNRQRGPLVFPLSRASPAGTRQRQGLCQVPPNPLGKGTSKGAHGVLLCRVPIQ